MESPVLTNEEIKKEIIAQYPCFDEEEEEHILELETTIARLQCAKVARLLREDKGPKGWGFVDKVFQQFLTVEQVADWLEGEILMTGPGTLVTLCLRSLLVKS